jgi:type VI secretion system protein ImpA
MTDSDILATHQQLLQAITTFQQLSASIDQRAGAAIPSSRIDQTLQRCLDTLTYLAGERLQRLLNTAPAPALTDTAEAAVPSGVTAVQTAIGNREQAVQQLRFLADLFRRTEPHSPVSYAIEQAVRWSQMSLPELMAELIDDSGARTHFCRLTGVPADQ